MADRQFPYLILRPITVRQVKRALEVFGTHSFKVSRPYGNNSKITDPNLDVLPVLIDFLNAFIDKGDYYYSIKQSVEVGKTPSLLGVFRALFVLKYWKPEIYEKFRKLASALSYEIDATGMSVAPLYALLGFVSDVFEESWKTVEKETGFTKELYARAIIDEFKRKGLFSDFALFYPSPDRDEVAVQEFLEEFQPPFWYENNPDVGSYSLYKNYAEDDLPTVELGIKSQALSKAVREIIEELKNGSKAVGDRGEDKAEE